MRDINDLSLSNTRKTRKDTSPNLHQLESRATSNVSEIRRSSARPSMMMCMSWRSQSLSLARGARRLLPRLLPSLASMSTLGAGISDAFSNTPLDLTTRPRSGDGLFCSGGVVRVLF